MRIVVQLVKEASVKIDNEVVGSIGNGLLLLVGFTNGDNPDIARKMAEKVCKLRIFPDSEGKTNLNIDAVNGNILSVSQFTLYGSVVEGNRPSFVNAMRPEEAKEMYQLFNNILRDKFPNLQTGIFQADMKVSLINDGPFTLVLDSSELVK